MIGIIGALPIEVALLLEKTENIQTKTASGYEYAEGMLCGQPVVIARCGVGKINAAVCVQTMILLYHPDLIIHTGVAGSLSSRLHIGDIAIAKDLVQHDVDTSALGDPIGFVSTVCRIDFPCDERAVAGILAAVNAQGLRGEIVRIASGDQFICMPEAKRRIVDLFGAEACEMEGGATAQVCFINRTPCVVIRAISDNGDDDHAMEYTQFAQMAAVNSANVIMQYLNDLK